jgi:hypothetical protein
MTNDDTIPARTFNKSALLRIITARICLRLSATLAGYAIALVPELRRRA